MRRKQLKATAPPDFLSEMPGTLELRYVWQASCGMDVRIAMKNLVTVLADTVRKAERGG